MVQISLVYFSRSVYFRNSETGLFLPTPVQYIAIQEAKLNLVSEQRGEVTVWFPSPPVSGDVPCPSAFPSFQGSTGLLKLDRCFGRARESSEVLAS